MRPMFGGCCSSQRTPENAEIALGQPKKCLPFFDHPLDAAQRKGTAPQPHDFHCTLDPEAPIIARQTEREQLSEDEEWQKRQRVTGVVGRLVQYDHDDDPTKDILGLSRTKQGRIMVNVIDKYGPAAIAGVTAGDQLVSINGQKDFGTAEPEDIRMSLEAPATLVFIGFAGHERGEVRINHGDEHLCGISDSVDVMLGQVHNVYDQGRAVQTSGSWLHDMSVFHSTAKQTPGSLFLQTKPGHSRGRPASPDSGDVAAGNADDAAGGAVVDGDALDLAAGVYELRRKEARLLVERAVRGPGDANSSIAVGDDADGTLHDDRARSHSGDEAASGVTYDMDDPYALRNI